MSFNKSRFYTTFLNCPRNLQYPSIYSFMLSTLDLHPPPPHPLYSPLRCMLVIRMCMCTVQFSIREQSIINIPGRNYLNCSVLSPIRIYSVYSIYVLYIIQWIQRWVLCPFTMFIAWPTNSWIRFNIRYLRDRQTATGTWRRLAALGPVRITSCVWRNPANLAWIGADTVFTFRSAKDTAPRHGSTAARALCVKPITISK